MSDIIELNSLEQLARYRLLWNRLFPDTPRASFFHTYDWLEAYWKHFGRDQRLRVLVVHSCGTPIGIVPLCVRVERFKVGRVRVLTYPLEDWGNWYSPIGGNPTACLLRAMQHIRDSRRDWDMVDLRWTGPTAADGGRPGRAMRIAGLEPCKEPYQSTSVIDIEGTWNSFLAERSSKHRSEFRRIARRTFEREDVEFIRHRPAPARDGDGDPRWDLFEMCQEVADRSWQASVADGNTLSSERVRDFLRDVHGVASRLGMVDMNLLLQHGRPTSFLYNYHYDGRVFGLRTGFDPTYATGGCGTALFLEALRDAFHRGDRSVDLGIGDEAFKQRLRTRVETSYRFVHLPLGSWRSQAVRLSQWAKGRIGRRAEATRHSA